MSATTSESWFEQLKSAGAVVFSFAACLAFAGYTLSEARTHLAPFKTVTGQVETVRSRVRGGFDFVHLRLAGETRELDWSCFIACDDRRALNGLEGRVATFDLMGREIAGAAAGGQKLIERDGSRRLALARDALGFVIAMAGAVAIGLRFWGMPAFRRRNAGA